MAVESTLNNPKTELPYRCVPSTPPSSRLFTLTILFHDAALVAKGMGL